MSSRSAKSRVENSDIVELVTYLSDLVMERDGSHAIANGAKIYGSIEAENVVRDIYLFIFEEKPTLEGLNVAVRCLILFAYVHDLNKLPPSGRKYRRKADTRSNGAENRTKLEYYMPEEAMDKMIAACRKVPLIELVSDWNQGTASFHLISGTQHPPTIPAPRHS
jgi:hypothetical protein